MVTASFHQLLTQFTQKLGKPRSVADSRRETGQNLVFITDIAFRSECCNASAAINSAPDELWSQWCKKNFAGHAIHPNNQTNHDLGIELSVIYTAPAGSRHLHRCLLNVRHIGTDAQMQIVIMLWVVFFGGLWVNYLDRVHLNSAVSRWAAANGYRLMPHTTAVEIGNVCRVWLLDQSEIRYAAELKIRGLVVGTFLERPKVLSLEQTQAVLDDPIKPIVVTDSIKCLLVTFSVAISALLVHSWSAYRLGVATWESRALSAVAVGTTLVAAIILAWPSLFRRNQGASWLSLSIAAQLKSLAIPNIIYLVLALALPETALESPLLFLLFFMPAFLLPRIPGSILAEVLCSHA